MSSQPRSGHQHALRLRQRQVLPQWASMVSCDFCQTRKIKCARLLEGTSDCEACVLRKKKCLGGRSKTAKHHQQGSNQPDDSRSDLFQKTVAISTNSPDSNLHRVEISETLMADLLASFFEHSDEQAPYANYIALQTEFDRAGRRLGQLTPLTQPLILAMIASSAQYSDSSILLGPQTPHLRNLDLLGHSNRSSLVRFGNQRQALCEQLIIKALELMDAQGLFRKPSPQSVSILMMYGRIMREPAPLKWNNLEEWRGVGHMYLSASMQHIRSMYEIPGTAKYNIGGIQWPLIIGDASYSAIHGRPMVVTDDDILNFPHMQGLPPPSPQLVRQFIMSSNPTEFLIPLLAIASTLVKIFRRVATTISIPLAKGKHVSLTTFSDRIQEVRQCLSVLRECEQVAKEYETLVAPEVKEIQKNTFGASMPTVIRVAPVTPALLIPALHKQFNHYKERYHRFEPTYEDHLHENRIESEIEKGLLQSISIVTDAICDLEGKNKVASLTRQTSLLVPLQQTLGWYYDLAYDIDTAEQGGVESSWTFEAKSRNLRILIDAIRLQTWAWNDREEEANECERRYQRFVDCWVAFLSNTGPASASHPTASNIPTPTVVLAGGLAPAPLHSQEFDLKEDYADLWNR